MDINFIGYFIAGCSYFWLNYRGRRSHRLYVNFPQVLDLKAFFFFLTWDFYNPLPSRWKTLGFYFVIGGAFILYLQLILTIYITNKFCQESFISYVHIFG